MIQLPQKLNIRKVYLKKGNTFEGIRQVDLRSFLGK
jgi:hypothetical protein